ncbi:MAG: protein SCO1/2 [Chitinophagales bacterium]|jgi:protein SCO1/2
MLRSLLFVSIISLLIACKPERKLPVYGMEFVKTEAGYDTIINKVAPFEFVDQKGEVVNNATFQDKVFITDFFFTSCPSICPVMTKQMLRVHDAYLDNPTVTFLSHSIDPDRDNIQKLDAYSGKININTNDRWHFVTGEKEAIFDMAEHYMIVAFADEDVPGGFEHSGYFILVDKDQQIRGYYDGTSENDVTTLIEDLAVLLNE